MGCHNENVDLAVETQHVSKVFRTFWSGREVRAVDDVSLQVRRGTTFGLLGPNGAGKTTYVKLLLALIRPTQGGAKIFGRDARLTESRRSVGYLPESHRFPMYMTGAGMLDFYAALSGMNAGDRKKRIPELLELVGLGKWGDFRLKKYSKGMLQRLGLAQALMHSPSMLILDEPTDGVDPLGRRQIREILRAQEEKGVTVFINSHLLVEVELFCREVAILDRGKVALVGKVKELTAGKGYRLTATEVPDRLAETLRARAAAFAAKDGLMEFQFQSRAEVNEVVDLLRAERCEIEAIAQTSSTLEDVFMRTVNA
jgi:ABC-2 type transport system ATP-binding protein